MAVICTLKPIQTYKEFIDALMNFVTPKNELEPLTIDVINDTYIKYSVKEGTRQDRSEAGPRVHIQSVNQHRLQGMRWKNFLYNGGMIFWIIFHPAEQVLLGYFPDCRTGVFGSFSTLRNRFFFIFHTGSFSILMNRLFLGHFPQC